MSWVLLDDNFPNHPKAVQAGPVAAYLYVCGLCYCRRFHTGGFIPAKAVPMLGASPNQKRMIDALVTAGLWDTAEGGWQIHDYIGFYADEDDKAAKRDALSATRREAGRRGGQANALANGKQIPDFATSKEHGMERTGVLALEEKKVEADFGVFWAHYPRKDGKHAALTEWRKLKPSNETQHVILSDLERRCQSSGWLKDAGQFIPHARTYLYQKRWEDGFEERPNLTDKTIQSFTGAADFLKGGIRGTV